MQLGRSTKILGNIKLPPPLNFTCNWEDQQRYQGILNSHPRNVDADADDHDDDVDEDDDDDDNDASPVVIAGPGKTQAFAVYIHIHIHIYIYIHIYKYIKRIINLCHIENIYIYI